jgi:hypothetical protein
MPPFAKNTRATVIPCLRYRDAPAAIEWLCRAFGFEKQLVVPNRDGTIAHAQLRFGNGMIMLGSVLDSDFGRLMRQPDDVGGAETQTPLCDRLGCRRAPCAREGRRRRDRAGHQGRGLRRPRFHLSRSGGPSLGFRSLRSVGGAPFPAAGARLAPFPLGAGGTGGSSARIDKRSMPSSQEPAGPVGT